MRCRTSIFALAFACASPFAASVQAAAITHDPSDYGNACNNCKLGTTPPGLIAAYDLSLVTPNGSPGLAYALGVTANQSVTVNFSSALGDYGLLVCGAGQFPPSNGLPCVPPAGSGLVTLSAGVSSLVINPGTFAGTIGFYAAKNGAVQPNVTSVTGAATTTVPEPGSMLLLSFGLAALLTRVPTKRFNAGQDPRG